MIDEISIYIPGHSIVDDSLNFLSFLKNISYSRIQLIQTKIEKLDPSLQYSVVPYGYGTTAEEAKRLSALSNIGIVKHQNVESPIKDMSNNFNNFVYKGQVWKPPFPDAVDTIIDRVLNRSTVMPMHGFSDEDMLRFDKIQETIAATDPEYAGFGSTGTSLSKKDRKTRRKKKSHS